MGDNTPEVIDLQCQNCGAEFRLRPTKGRLPKGPVKCPECGEQIPVPDSAEPPPPMAAVLRPKKGSSDSSMEMDALAQAMADVPAGGTLIGAPIAVGFERAETKVNEHGPVPSEVFDDEEPEERTTQKLQRKQLHTDLDETSESVFNNTTRHPWENELPPEDDATEQITSEVDREDTVNDAQVLDDKRTTRPNLAANKPGGKPKLSDLLKKVRQKRGVAPTQPMVPIPSLPKKSAEEIFGDFDEVIDESADDLVSSAAALKTQKLKKPSRPTDPPKMDPTIETTIRETMRDDLGMAGENVGSGYIRIPTAEILDVIGSGSYRLRVEDVVYEPVDEKGLVRLIKGGVLMGAEEIAEADGDWMPVDEHPVIRELRKRMAEEAHRLLAEVASGAPAPSPAEEDDAQADLDEVFELEDLEEQSYAPPPLPSVADDATIESPPPVVQDDGGFDEQPDTVPLPSIEPPAEGLMNTSAVDEIAGAIEAEKPGLFDGTSVVDEIVDVVGDPGPGTEAPEASDEFEIAEPTPFDEDSFGTGDSFAADDAGTPAVEMSAEEVDEFLDEPTPKKSNAGLFGVLFILVLAAVGVVGSAYMGFINIPGITPSEPQPANNAVKDPTPANNTNNVVAAADAGEDDQGTAEQNPLEAAQAAYDSEPTPENAAALVDQLVAAGQNEAAITLLEEAVKMEGGDTLQAKLDELKPPPPTPKGPQVIAQSDWTNAEMVDIKRHKVFEADFQGKRYQVIVDRGQPLRAWRAVLASYRLCEMMKCGFKIPNTFEFSMKKADWQAFSKESKVRVSGVSFTKADEDELLLGAMVEKLPESVAWPIDASGIWRDLIDDPETANKPLTDTLEKVAAKETIADQLGTNGAKLAGPALSSLLVFDYLTNNFSRIGRGESTVVKDEAFYSIHNFDCFQTRASTRVKGRFRWASRYNKEQIDSLRNLKPEEIDLVLFPDASRAEQSALKVFWKQRDEIIERVDDQLKGGEDKTFF